MNKRDFYSRHGLKPDSGNLVNAWGAIHGKSATYLLQCWNDEKTFIRREDRTDEAIMTIKILTPADVGQAYGGAPARVRTVAAIRAGAKAFVAISTGKYPNWADSANVDQVYPVLSVYDRDGEVFARVSTPVETNLAFPP